MMINMKVLIVIVNYNGFTLLQKHLDSVLNTEYPNFEVLVVDNGSIDGSVDFLKNYYPQIKVLRSKENLGFGRGNNLGVYENPEYDAYVFLNNDMSVEKDWLKELISVVKEKENVGAVGPKILYSKKKEGKYVINSAGIELDKHYMGYDRYAGEYDNEKYNVIEEVDALCGGALLITKKAWDMIGGFNSHMFMYYEDVDISLRLRDFGFKLYYCGKSVVYHDHMGSTGKMGSFKRNFMSMKNRYLSIGSRLGFLVGLTETIWYIFHWLVWKLIYSKRITLRKYLERKQ